MMKPSPRSPCQKRKTGLPVEDRAIQQALLGQLLAVAWLSNANLVASNTFGLNYGQNYGNDIYGNPRTLSNNGSATWAGAQIWVAAIAEVADGSPIPGVCVVVC